MQVAPRRPEYRALIDELPTLMADFGCTIDAAELDDVAVFTAAMECVDRVIDAVADRDERRALAEAIIAQLAGDAPVAVPELADRLAELRAVSVRRGFAGELVKLSRATLASSELLRTTKSIDIFLDAIEAEGVCAAEMALLCMQPHANARLAAFFVAVAQPSNLGDKLIDARADHRRGELALTPTPWLYVRLVARILRRGVPAALLHPRLARFVVWSARSTARLLVRDHGIQDRGGDAGSDRERTRDRATIARRAP